MISENFSSCSIFEIQIPFAYDGMTYIKEAFKEDILRDFTVDDIKIYSNKEDFLETCQYLSINYKEAVSEDNKQANATYHRNTKAIVEKSKMIKSYNAKSSRTKDTLVSLNEQVKKRYQLNKYLSMKRKLN